MAESAIPPTEINLICDRFEDLWRRPNVVSGVEQPPEISGFLIGVSEVSRGVLLSQLLAIDIEFRRQLDSKFTASIYSQLGYDAYKIANQLLKLQTEPRSPEIGSSSFILDSPPGNVRSEDLTLGDRVESGTNSESQRIGPYKLLQQVGDGGMGTVWMAEQISPVRRRVALKVIKSGLNSRQVIARFEAERQALAIMDHPNIAKVLDAGTTDDGRPYFVMELVKGIPFTEYCDQNKLSIKQRLELFMPVCKAVQHAHQKGIIHRDLKPSNVLVALHDGQPVPKVIDFGLAKAIGNESQLTEKTMFTEFGQVVGTLQYMSPEQAELNSLDVDTRTDIYSLGVMLYELLTGSTPIEREVLRKNAFIKILETIREFEPPPPSTRLSSSGDAISGISLQRQVDPIRLQQLIRGELDWIVMKSIEKDRARRYPTASEFCEDILRYLNDDVVEARPPTTFYRFQKLVQRNRGPFAAIAGLFTVLVLGIVTTTAGLRWALKERKNAIVLKTQADDEKERADEASLIASEQRDRAREEEKKARIAQSLAEKNERMIESNLAKSNYFLANARWNERRVREARSALNLIPTIYRKLEWYLTQRQFEASSLTFYGHTNRIRSVVFSPKGDVIASGSEDNRVKLWDSITGQELMILAGHLDAVTSLAFNSDGSCLASASEDGTIKLWDPKSGLLLKTLTGHTDEVNCVAFSPFEDELASGSRDRTVKIWNFRSGEELMTLRDHTHSVSSLQFSSDGRKLASVGHQKLLLWNTEQYALGKDIDIHDAFASDAAFDPMGRYMAVAGSNGSIAIIDSESGLETGRLSGHDGAVRCIEWSPDGKRLVSSADDQTIKVWDASQGTEIGSYIGHSSNVAAVAFSPDGRRMVSGSWDSTIKVWSVTQSNEASIFSSESGEITCVAFNPQSDQIASAGHDNGIQIWDVWSGRSINTLVGHNGRVNSVAFSPDGRFLASGGEDNYVKVWNLREGNSVEVLSGHSGMVYRVAFSPNGKLLASASRDRTVRIWDLQTGIEISTLKGHQLYVQGVAFSPDGDRIASSSADATVKIWDVATGQELLNLAGHGFVVSSVAFSPDGKLVASGSEDSTCKIWDANSGSELHTLIGHKNFVNDVAFDPTGERLASVSSDRTIKIWDVREGIELTTLSGGNGALQCVSFSPDGKFLASGGRDQSIALRSCSSDVESRSLVGHSRRITDLYFSDDDTRIYSQDISAVKKVWDFESGIEMPNEKWVEIGSPRNVSNDQRWLLCSMDGEILIVDQHFKSQANQIVHRRSLAKPPAE